MIRPVRLFFVGCTLALLAVALPAAGGGATQVTRDTQTFSPGAQVAASNWSEMPNLTMIERATPARMPSTTRFPASMPTSAWRSGHRPP